MAVRAPELSMDSIVGETSRSGPADDPAFVRLLIENERAVRAFVLSLVVNWADAEEITQETLVRLYEQRGRFDPEGDFRSWACTVARYQVLTYCKRLGREKVFASQAFVECVAEEHEAELDDFDFESRRRALGRCLEKLDAERRRLLDLAYGGDRPIAEVAAVVGRTVAATYKALARIRKSLYDCVQRSVGTEAPQ